MARVKRLLVCGVISAALWLLLLAGLAWADPANARLDVTPNTTAAAVGERITVTVELVTMDAAEAFRSWNVRLRYNTTTLEVADHTIYSGFWSGCSFTTPAFNQNPNDLYFGEACFGGGNSGTSTPFLLATIVFTVTGDGYSDFVVVTTDINNDTTFVRPDCSHWQPGTINTSQATLPVTVASIAAHTGTRVWVILLAVGLVVAMPLGVWTRRVYGHRHSRLSP
jgi:hypothetical protein